jgi:hypothetical protein
MIALAVEADDEHGTPMAITDWLVRGNHRNISANRRCIAEALAEATAAKLVGTAKVLD